MLSSLVERAISFEGQVKIKIEIGNVLAVNNNNIVNSTINFTWLVLREFLEICELIALTEPSLKPFSTQSNTSQNQPVAARHCLFGRGELVRPFAQ